MAVDCELFSVQTRVALADDDPTGFKGAAQFILSPLGGFVIALLLFPAGGCAVETSIANPCPAGKQQDVLGSTVGGLVGAVDQAGATIIGVVAAVLCCLIAAALKKSQPLLSRG